VPTEKKNTDLSKDRPGLKKPCSWRH